MSMNFLRDRREEYLGKSYKTESVSLINLPGWPVKPKSKRGIVFLCIVIISAAGLIGYLGHKSGMGKNSIEINSKEFSNGQGGEIDTIISEVSKLMVLPDNEKPTVATVSDPIILQGQPFFFKAKKGDKVLIYTKAQKAILYDPVANKIINVAPINIGNK